MNKKEKVLINRGYVTTLHHNLKSVVKDSNEFLILNELIRLNDCVAIRLSGEPEYFKCNIASFLDEDFPFISQSTIRRVLKDLEDKELIKKQVVNNRELYIAISPQITTEVLNGWYDENVFK